MTMFKRKANLTINWMTIHVIILQKRLNLNTNLVILSNKPKSNLKMILAIWLLETITKKIRKMLNLTTSITLTTLTTCSQETLSLAQIKLLELTRFKVIKISSNTVIWFCLNKSHSRTCKLLLELTSQHHNSMWSKPKMKTQIVISRLITINKTTVI